MTPAEIGTHILQEASKFGHTPTYQDTLPRVSKDYIQARLRLTEVRRRWKAGECSEEEIKAARRERQRGRR
eukprot:2704082-Pyramimonas_sp.AAC.1